MKHSTSIYFIKSLVFLLFLIIASCSFKEEDFSERTKVALRDAGHNLLLSNRDSISLILPVKELSPNKFQLSFHNSLGFEPNILVEAISNSFVKSNLPEHYIVEVIQCKDREVAYSYQMTTILESTIIPCEGRYLPNACYFIEVNFTENVAANHNLSFFIGLFGALVFIGLVFWWYKKKNNAKTTIDTINYEALGIFKFYPEQNILIKEAEEIALSKKECELLALFVERPNEVIKRDELTKRVWEDNGVFVGRSLDTYISKLRKKLQADTSIKLTNVHGVGYKLELN